MFPPPFDSFFRSDAGVVEKRAAESKLRRLVQREFLENVLTEPLKEFLLKLFP
jgi:hypothetical protein